MKDWHPIKYMIYIVPFFIFCIVMFNLNGNKYSNPPIQLDSLAIEDYPGIYNPDSPSFKNETNKTSSIVNSGKSTEEGYEMLHVVFAGKPEIESIKRLLKVVMEKYGLEENFENINRTGSALLALREDSAIGVTEMEILKHMYQHGDPTVKFPTQAGISSLYLEQTQ
ncbi:hypothetical protein QG516_21590 [Pedobacter gandavensis]|uniref:hypothetical protein n=1 Tax=Pedobacter gandavensis TaxID=2679963 RepID=UPI002479BECE|nr:hypothetical protein [Pedobacter gandavensis]WGQ09108.1 hypothetical protein QG516_21590 [Pedobacter gandavensis]